MNKKQTLTMMKNNKQMNKMNKYRKGMLGNC